MLAPAEVALIFDLDQTLIHTRIDFVAIRHRLIDLLYEHGVTDQPRDSLLRLALPELADLGRRRIPELGAAMWTIIKEAEDGGLQGAEPVAHAVPVLEALRHRGFRLALLTNNARPGAIERLKMLGLTRAFEVVVTRDEVGGLKPLPDGVHYILQRLPGIKRTCVIGDAWIDAQAAYEAGARFIGFGGKEASVRERGLPIWKWITDLRELLEVDYGS